MEGGVVSLYDMVRVRLAAFWLPSRSETPPGRIVKLLGWLRFSKDALSVCASVTVMVSLACDTDATAISEEPSSRRILPVTGVSMSSSMATVSVPDVVSYEADVMPGGVGTPGAGVAVGGVNPGGMAVPL